MWGCGDGFEVGVGVMLCCRSNLSNLALVGTKCLHVGDMGKVIAPQAAGSETGLYPKYPLPMQYQGAKIECSV